MTTFISENLIVRKARLRDVGEIARIVNFYAERQQMLPKTHLQLYENLRDFSVVENKADPSGQIIACGALHIYWENLAEIRAIAVAEGMNRKGIGKLLAERLIDEARELGLEQVFCFTYVPKFFNSLGFIQVEHSVLPLKVYNECFQCPKFNNCDEIAMVLQL
ncbi:MAG: N-acetyltransferase [Acidobacteriota bacterium]|jgi:amino-acid N-acetyltransferase|nr:N-acetyltransferase [Acidobacteriota bacterium]